VNTVYHETPVIKEELQGMATLWGYPAQTIRFLVLSIPVPHSGAILLRQCSGSVRFGHGSGSSDPFMKIDRPEAYNQDLFFFFSFFITSRCRVLTIMLVLNYRYQVPFL
jgi:hypothetical protein